MKFKTILSRALNAADLICVDGYEVESDCMQGDAVRRLELADGNSIVFTDQEIEIDEGQTFVDDIDGEEHELIFTCSHRLTETDLRP